jgi:hypothetical protein
MHAMRARWTLYGAEGAGMSEAWRIVGTLLGHSVTVLYRTVPRFSEGIAVGDSIHRYDSEGYSNSLIDRFAGHSEKSYQRVSAG